MATKRVYTNAHFSIAGTDLSTSVSELGLEMSVEEVTATAMGDGTMPNLAGLKDYTVNVTFRQDFGSGQVDATLWPIFGTAVAVSIRADAGAISATNPEYRGTMLFSSYNPLGGGVGDILDSSITLRPGGTNHVLTRHTS